MIFNKLPRFQFFHDLSVLITALITLIFSDKKSTQKSSQFLQKMKDYFGREDAHVVSSFRIGLYHTLKALNLKPDDEVLLTSITVADSVNSIRLNKLKPVLIDLDPETHSISLEDLKHKVGPRSKVLVVTYLSGIVPDIDAIRDLASTYNLLLIEDISQNMGAKFKGKKIGSHGDVSIASLSCGKNISTLYGGLILSDNAELMQRIRGLSLEKTVDPEKHVLAYYLLNSIKVQIATTKVLFAFCVYPLLRVLSFITNKYPIDFDHDPSVKNNIFISSKPILRSNWPELFFSPVNDWQIKLTEHQLKNIDEGTKKRRKLAKVLLENLSKNSLRFIPRGLMNTSECSYYHFPIFCGGNKGQLRKHLFLSGIDNGSYGLNLCSEETVFNLEYQVPGACKIKHDTVFLPIHESYSDEQMILIAKSINEYFALFVELT